jgi:hypothetical protein
MKTSARNEAVPQKIYEQIRRSNGGGGYDTALGDVDASGV